MKGRSIHLAGAAVILMILIVCFIAGCISPNKQGPITPAITRPVNTATFPTPIATVPTLSDGSDIKIQMNDFDPAILVIMNGTTVTWTNYDENTNYSVVSDNGTPESFRSSEISKGRTFQFRFTLPGTYPYHSETLSRISGEIVVR